MIFGDNRPARCWLITELPLPCFRPVSIIVRVPQFCHQFFSLTNTLHSSSRRRVGLPAASSGAIPLLSLGYQRHKWPKLKLILAFSNILVCCCCSSWPGLPEPPSLRSKPKEHSQSFRALPANKTSWANMSELYVRCSMMSGINRNLFWSAKKDDAGDYNTLGLHTVFNPEDRQPDLHTGIQDQAQIQVVPQIDPSVPQPVVQSRRRPLLGPSLG